MKHWKKKIITMIRNIVVGSFVSSRMYAFTYG